MSAGAARRTALTIITGLTPGQALTWTWAGSTNSTLRVGGEDTASTTQGGPAVMVVTDAPF